jgi:hypothetical protein
MIIIFNLSGLILAGAGIVAGLFVIMVSGWISPGLLTLAVIWFVGGFWWRNQKVAPRVKRPYPALFFIPLPFLAIPVAFLAALGFVVEWGGHGQPADRRAELLRADVRMLDSAAASGDVQLSQKILATLQAIPVPVEGNKAEPFHVATRKNGDAVLVLVKAPQLKSYQNNVRKTLLQKIADLLQADEQLKEKRIFIGIKGRLTFGAIQTPPDDVQIGSVVPELPLYDFYDAPAVPVSVTPAGKKLGEKKDSQVNIPVQRDGPEGGKSPAAGKTPKDKATPRLVGDKPEIAKPALPTTARAEQAAPPVKPARNRAPAASKPSKADDRMPGEFRRFTQMRWGVKSLAFSPTAGLLAAGKLDRALMLFDVANDARLDGLDKLQLLQSVTSCVFTPDGSHLLAGGSTGHIQIYEVSKEGLLTESAQFAGHSQEVSCMAVSGDGKLAVSGGKEKKLRFWEVDTGREQAAFPGCEGPIKACLIAKDGQTALATDGATLLSIDLEKKEVTRRRQLARSWASGQAAAFSADGEQVAVGDRYTVRLWNLNSRDESPKLEDKEIQWSMAFTPDGTRLVSGGNSKVNVWDVRNGRKLQAFAVAGHGYIQSLAVSPDNKYVAAIPSSAGQDLQVFHLGPAD